MRGHILKRKSGYTIVYDIGLKWDEGKQARVRQQKWEKVPWKEVNGKWVAPSKTDAQKCLTKILAQLNKGEFVEPTKITFRDFKNIWMENYAVGEGQIRPSTLAQYRGFFRNHLMPAFGDMQIAKISVEDIQGFKAEMLKRGKKVKKVRVVKQGGIVRKVNETVNVPLSPQTVKHMLRLIRQMFDHAIDWGYIKNNPAKKVRLPKVPKKEMDALSLEEIRIFLNKVPEKWYAFFLTAITTGLRVGELLAMRWGNLDWNREQYFVKETWLRSREGSQPGFGEPKTESSVAAVDLTPSCLSALTVHRQHQAEEELAAGEDYQNQDLIFATALGTSLNSWNLVKRVFNPALKAAGLRHIRFHDLRHTCASLLISQGESPKYIQKQLRHSSVNITFDRYGHLFPEENREAERRIDDTLFGWSLTEQMGQHF